MLEAALEAMADRPQDLRGSGLQQSRDGSGRGGGLTQERVCAELSAVVARAEESATATTEAMESDEQLPDVWELTYRAALALARGAAVDELLGNAAASMRSYVKVGRALPSLPSLLLATLTAYIIPNTWSHVPNTQFPEPKAGV